MASQVDGHEFEQVLGVGDGQGSLVCYIKPWVCSRTPLSIGFWSGLPFLSPGDLLDPGIEPASLALAGGFFTAEPPVSSLSPTFHPLLIQL